MTTTLTRFTLVLAIAALAACASRSPHNDKQFGMAARSSVQQQILHPGVPSSQSVTGMDGAAAKSAYDNYQKSYKDPVPQTGALAIGVGR